MAYNPIHTRACPIDEAFTDPIRARNRADGQMVFQKYQNHTYTQPIHFPNYLNQYTPNFPPPPKSNQGYNFYPRSNLVDAPYTEQPLKEGVYVATHRPATDCGRKYW